MRNSTTLKYAFVGVLFGLFFPLFALLLDGFFFKHLAFGWNMVIQLHTLNPIHFVIDSAPFILGAAFALMGYYADKLVQSYEKKNINSENYSKKNKAILRKLRIGSLATPLVIGVLLVVSYLFIQSFLSDQQNDAPVINISGKQRMLSQEIAKNALYLTVTQGEEQVNYINSLDEAVREFKTAHENLIGTTTTLEFSQNHINSSKVVALYDSLLPYYNGLLAGIEEILEANEIRDLVDKKVSMRDAIQKIEQNESSFLILMNKIVVTYEEEAQKKLTYVQVAQLVVVVILILFVGCFAIFVLKPMVDGVKRAFIDIESASKTLEGNNKELAASEEKLRQNAEQMKIVNDELTNSQGELKKYINRVSQAKKMAKLAAYDLDIQTNKITHTEHLNYLFGIDESIKINSAYLERVIHAEDYPILLKSQKKIIESNKDTSYRLRIKTETFNDWHWFQGAIHGVFDKKGKLIYIVNGLQDITESVKKEQEINNLLQEMSMQNQELQASEEELRQNTEQLQLINDTLFVAQREVEEKQNLLKRAEKISQIGSFDIVVQNLTFQYSENLAVMSGLDSHKMGDIREHQKYFREEEGKLIRENLKELLQGKRNTFSMVGHFMPPNQKETKILKLEANLLRDSYGNPERILGVVQDVTQITIQKEALEQSQQQLESISNNLQGIMYRCLIDEDWTMKFISKGIKRITGYEASDFIDNKVRSFASIIHPKDDFIGAEIEQANKTKEPYKLEYRLIHKNGAIIWVEETGQIVEDKINKVDYLDGVLMDITQRKQTEKIIEIQTHKLITSQRELVQQQQMLSDAEKMAKMGSYVWDIHTNQIKHSENLATIYGLEKDTLIEPIIFDSIIHPEDGELHQKTIDEAMMRGQKEVFTTYRAKPSHLSEKHWKHYRIYSIIKYNEKRESTTIIGTAQDITEEVERQKMQEKISAQIERQNKNLMSSINYAQRIQSAMLGGTQDLKQIFKDAFVFFEPKDVVSGDFYWYNEIGTRKIAIVGDCTGHGVPGAFMSLLGTTLLNEIILQRQITTPSKILDFMQSEIRRILKQDTTGNRDGMDMAVVMVDKSVGMMEFAGAKNPLVYIHKVRKKGGSDTNLALIKGDVHPIGGRTEKFMNIEYTNHVIDLENVEAFYIYSDGYQDQFGGEEGRKFMSTKFRELLYTTHSTSMRHQRVSLKRNLMNWMGTEYDQIDDICVMGITV